MGGSLPGGGPGRGLVPGAAVELAAGGPLSDVHEKEIRTASVHTLPLADNMWLPTLRAIARELRAPIVSDHPPQRSVVLRIGDADQSVPPDVVSINRVGEQRPLPPLLEEERDAG